MPRKPRPADTKPNEPKPVCVPAGAPEWVTSELLEHTIRVRQPYYEHPLTPEDALEIILTVGGLMEVLSEEN